MTPGQENTGKRESEHAESWESWDLMDFLSHSGQTVEVRCSDQQHVLIRGAVSEYTDLLGGPGILEYGNYGLDRSGRSVVAVLGAPIPPSCWLSLSKKSHYQTSFREGMRTPNLEEIAAFQTEISRSIGQWRNSFSAWLQQYQFRPVRSSC